MDDWEVFPREAAAVAMKAIEQGIALRTDLTFEQEVEEATAIIARARGLVQDAMASGYVRMPEGSHPPVPTRQAYVACARGAGDMAADAAKAAADAAEKAARAAAEAAARAAEAVRKVSEKYTKSDAE